MYKFKEIIGAKLESITDDNSVYVDFGGRGNILNTKGLSLDFDKGWFVIENPHTVLGASSLSEIVGLKVVDAFSNDKEISLIFDNSIVLSVSLKDEDFIGPEAASYSPKHGEIIVFN